jgi:signal transduction histidine kinase
VLFRSYENRARLALAGASVALVAAVIGLVFYRAIAKPIRMLVARADAIARGEDTADGAIPLHGTAELAHLSDRMLAMARELRRRADYMATFAAHVSHELKSPLTAIQGAAELMRDNDMTEAERARFLDNIVADATRLGRLLQRLRELARAEQTPLAGEVRPGELLAALRAAHPTVTIDFAGEECALRISPENLGALLTQLVANAAQHGATRVTITAARADETTARLVVADDGRGVSPGNREKIFDNFFTTRRESGGAGMGLSIARALAAAHDGDIVLADGPAGATFVITLPRA